MKAIAVPYVVALILGMVIIGLIGYWITSQGGKAIGVGSRAQCESLCVAWRNSAFNLKPSNIETVCKNQITGFAVVQPPQRPPVQPSPLPNILTACKNLLECLFKQSCDSSENDYGYNTQNTARVCCKS